MSFYISKWTKKSIQWGMPVSIPFKEIWHNPAYVDFRTKLLHGRKNIDICANCSEGSKVFDTRI